MSRNDLLDEGENRALRTFLMQYGLPGLTVGAMRDHMRRSGWDSCWPEWVTTSSKDSHLTKAGAQLWIRHLISLESVAEQSPQAPCGESIDTPEFGTLLLRLVAALKDGDMSSVATARAALIAHIDAKLTAARRVTEGWIDLKDQKPKDWQRVLVALNTGTVCEGYRGSVGWNWAETDHPDDAEATATHWKPWPKHPGAAAPALGKERSKHADQA